LLLIVLIVPIFTCILESKDTILYLYPQP
jgi:hypothetical protein